ncbi:hypothetical protein BE21_39165 [Sorangium cellulosum]|uniref:Uncharacterized protein n=1 Tax=Sorangium cellulosum TaxID=56 RepID=A0A150TLY4_SORCE|nr:hypothetical protein BE21_39165 [Sorangium cellulosum]
MRSTRAMSGAGGAGGTCGTSKNAFAGRARRWRRAVLGTLALSALAAPAISSGCVAGFDPPSLVNGLRVFAVVADVAPTEAHPEASSSYAYPGAQVTFKIHYQDGLGGPEEGSRPVSVYWFGGCENPVGDDYYGCYPQLAELAPKIAAWAEQLETNPNAPLPELNGVPIGIFSDTYTITVSDKILEGREAPATGGPRFGSAYVFFVACTGQLGAVEDQGTGRAGTFPVACFDADGRRLGPDSFVPGYTQVYVFEDSRANENPEMRGLTFDGDEMSEDLAAIPTVERCPIDRDERRDTGCSAEDPFTACTTHAIDAIIPPNVAENDLDAKQKSLKEIVWVNYFADMGDLDGGIKLVSDAAEGYLDDHAVTWIPPSEPGIATITAVLRDARGGSSVVQRLVRVK